MTVKKIINDWDPYSLFPYAPIDEYDEEIRVIESYILQNSKFKINELANFIKDLFDEDLIVSEKQDYIRIAKKILG